MARQGEADRHQTGSLIKHLVSLPASTYVVCNFADMISDGRKAWYRKDEQQISGCPIYFVLDLHQLGAADKRIKFGVQGALDTRSWSLSDRGNRVILYDSEYIYHLPAHERCVRL
jgi:hypothetical protein